MMLRHIFELLSNLESAPLNTSAYRVSIKTKHFVVSGQNFPKKVF